MVNKKKFVFIFSILGILTQPASAEVLSLSIEPIVGYEKVQQVLPSVHTVNRLVYGARAIAGVLILSAESEYTRGTVEEVIGAMTQKTTADKAKLGLRSGFRLGQLISLHLRGGVQVKREESEQTVDGVTNTFKQAIAYNPYGGAGARASLTSKLSATADVVAVIPDVHDMAQNEYLVTAGFAIRLP